MVKQNIKVKGVYAYDMDNGITYVGKPIGRLNEGIDTKSRSGLEIKLNQVLQLPTVTMVAQWNTEDLEEVKNYETYLRNAYNAMLKSGLLTEEIKISLDHVVARRALG